MTEAALPSWNDVNGNLARDYIQGASNFIWAAEKICTQVEENTGEWLFKLENPVTFLLGHSAELLLKAGLAKLGILENKIGKCKLKNSHDLIILRDNSRIHNIPLDDKFCAALESVNDNFVNFDHRYQRSFAGFPDSEHERLMSLLNERPNEESTKAEMRKYGLVVKQRADIKRFLSASQEQLRSIVRWTNTT